ncbi:MAG: MATE family efflux transporter [Halomonadaceae bacterium]|nr:MAG: MATE family efflux transporter [Halomonadaceae bacterium]
MLFGVLALMSYQLVDSAFIGQLGVQPLAALGFTLPVQMLVIGIQVGLGIATTAVISRTLGAGNEQRARQLGGLVVVGGALVILALCLALWLARPLILAFMGADAALLPLISSYWQPWLLSAWLGATLYFGYSLCRAQGDTTLPGVLMVITSLINVTLDPLFIFVFDWGLPGAAWATVVSFACGNLVVFRRLIQRRWISLQWRGLGVSGASRELGRIATPAMMSQLMPPLAAMLATGLVAGFGEAAVGAWGLGNRLEFFSIVVVLALTMSLPPMIGRLLGAGELEQIKTLIGTAVRFVVVFQLIIAGLWLVLSGLLTPLFSSEPQVQSLLQDYLLRVPLSYSALGVCMLMVSACNAMGLPLRALVISCLRLFLCFLPPLWLGAQLGGVQGLFTGAMIGNLAAGLMAWQLYRQGLRHLYRFAPEATG